jgi:hypothetical protein
LHPSVSFLKYPDHSLRHRRAQRCSNECYHSVGTGNTAEKQATPIAPYRLVPCLARGPDRPMCLQPSAPGDIQPSISGSTLGPSRRNILIFPTQKKKVRLAACPRVRYSIFTVFCDVLSLRPPRSLELLPPIHASLAIS